MKNNKSINLNISGSRLRTGLLATCVIAVAACSKMDDYKEKYVPNGEKTYTGKIDSVKIFSGKNRVRFSALINPDPRITNYRVYWGGRADSATFELKTSGTGDLTISEIINNVPEGEQTFEFVTFDASGNKSVSTFQNGAVYGTRYQESLSARTITGSSLDADLQTELAFLSMDTATRALAAEVRYLKATGDSAVMYVPLASADTVIPNHKYGSEVVLRTLYKPNATAIDTFFTAYTKYQPVSGATWINLASRLVKNPGAPFQRATYDNSRWGTLADWITNADVKNVASGTYGGYELRSNVGMLSLEGGWGLAAVANGKIYQVVHLPYAGKWRFTAHLSTLGAEGTKYLVVNNGTTLPDFTQITSASYYNNFSTVAASATPTIEFTAAAETDVCIGFVANMPGTSSTGSYLKVARVSLSYYKE